MTTTEPLIFKTITDPHTDIADLVHLFQTTYPGRWGRGHAYRITGANATLTFLGEGRCVIRFTDLDGDSRRIEMPKGSSFGAIVETAQALNALVEDAICPF